MQIKYRKPTTPSQRLVSFIKEDLNKPTKNKSLIRPLKGPVGRGHGKVSTRHRSIGSKKNVRVIDFKRNKFNIPARVVSIEYDPTHGPRIALLSYIDGEKRYILAPQGLNIGDKVESGDKAEVRVGNALPLKNIPLGSIIHNIELAPGRGGQLVRGAGGFATVITKEGKYISVRLPSGEVRKILETCIATIGALSNEFWKNIKFGKAGRKRHMGVRPTVRGVAMAWKHPHGGSYSTAGVGRKSPLSPWGQPAKGLKTRKRFRTNKFIVKRRNSR